MDYSRYVTRMKTLYPEKYGDMDFDEEKVAWVRVPTKEELLLAEEPPAENNKGKSKKKKQRRRMSRTLREAVLERDGYTCRHCGDTSHLEVHHIIHRKNGGADELENLVTLCPLCHAIEHKDENICKVMLKSVYDKYNFR